MRLRSQRQRRRGTIVPLLAVTIVAVFALVALAVDIGLMAMARTHCQNAADAGAMAGVRILNGDASVNNNYAQAAPTAESVATANMILNEPITKSMVKTEVGYYAYNTTLLRFDPDFSGSKPANENWTAVRVTISAVQPMFFARVLGINSLPAEATATSVHRPRDIAIVLDFSGSMQYASEIGWPSSGDYSGSLNPDTVYPKFGHWSTLASVMQRTSSYVDSGGEVHGPCNLTIDTADGPPIINDFLFRDPNNGNALTNAFNRPTSPYNPMTWACPAPSDWDVQSNATVTYWNTTGTGKGGDPAPRYNKKLDPAATGTSYARNVWNFLTNTDPAYTSDHNKDPLQLGPGGGPFDPTTPSTPLDVNGYGPNFKGYSIGPGYYGKTFFYWPPDPRFDTTAVTQTPSTSDVAKDVAGKWMGDWRKRFFYNGGTTTPLDGDNARLWSTTTKQWNQAGGSTYAVNYSAILAWIKSGPQVLPPNLRAGRLLYYSAIPSSIPSSGLTQDQYFWKSYIDYVIGNATATTQKQCGYGRQPDSDTTFGTTRITLRSNINGPDNIVGNADDPYMNYSDNPVRPRLQFWFGPLSMVCFLASNNDANGIYSRNWLPGTCHESQSWHLKAGMNSALSDIQKNHPNDWASTIYFSGLNAYATARVPLGRDYTTMKNALFFPFSLLGSLSDPNAEIRPYNTSYAVTSVGDVPNADSYTSPELGFKVAYNQFSSATGFNGRRGAAKMIIFETDGVPNTPTNEGSVNTNLHLGSPPAYNSYYSPLAEAGFVGNNDATVVQRALDALQTACNLDSANPPGYSTTKVPVRAHAIGFGDLFQFQTTRTQEAKDFLLKVQKIGNTSPAAATDIEAYKYVTGAYNVRIDNLRQAMERIMDSGVQVSLIR